MSRKSICSKVTTQNRSNWYKTKPQVLNKYAFLVHLPFLSGSIEQDPIDVSNPNLPQ